MAGNASLPSLFPLIPNVKLRRPIKLSGHIVGTIPTYFCVFQNISSFALDKHFKFVRQRVIASKEAMLMAKFTEKDRIFGSLTCLTKTRDFDYENQAWVVNGRYIRCGHPESMACGCYGREHAGEVAKS